MYIETSFLLGVDEPTMYRFIRRCKKTHSQNQEPLIFIKYPSYWIDRIVDETYMFENINCNIIIPQLIEDNSKCFGCKILCLAQYLNKESNNLSFVITFKGKTLVDGWKSDESHSDLNIEKIAEHINISDKKEDLIKAWKLSGVKETLVAFEKILGLHINGDIHKIPYLDQYYICVKEEDWYRVYSPNAITFEKHDYSYKPESLIEEQDVGFFHHTDYKGKWYARHFARQNNEDALLKYLENLISNCDSSANVIISEKYISLYYDDNMEIDVDNVLVVKNQSCLHVRYFRGEYVSLEEHQHGIQLAALVIGEIEQMVYPDRICAFVGIDEGTLSKSIQSNSLEETCDLISSKLGTSIGSPTMLSHLKSVQEFDNGNAIFQRDKKSNPQ